MKQNYFKSIGLLLSISFLILLLGAFIYKGNVIEKTSIFNIYEEETIQIGEDFGLKGNTHNYNKIINEHKIGKGIFISKNIFLTAKHLFNKQNEYYIKIKNKKYHFEIIKILKDKDIILGKILKYESKNFIKNIGYNIYNKQKIFCYKNNKKIEGEVLNKNSNISEINLNNLIKTNIKLSPGDSGTALFNKNNELIGIFILIEKNNNISYAQKISLR